MTSPIPSLAGAVPLTIPLGAAATPRSGSGFMAAFLSLAPTRPEGHATPVTPSDTEASEAQTAQDPGDEIAASPDTDGPSHVKPDADQGADPSISGAGSRDARDDLDAQLDLVAAKGTFVDADDRPRMTPTPAMPGVDAGQDIDRSEAESDSIEEPARPESPAMPSVFASIGLRIHPEVLPAADPGQRPSRPAPRLLDGAKDVPDTPSLPETVQVRPAPRSVPDADATVTVGASSSFAVGPGAIAPGSPGLRANPAAATPVQIDAQPSVGPVRHPVAKSAQIALTLGSGDSPISARVVRHAVRSQDAIGSFSRETPAAPLRMTPVSADTIPAATGLRASPGVDAAKPKMFRGTDRLEMVPPTNTAAGVLTHNGTLSGAPVADRAGQADPNAQPPAGSLVQSVSASPLKSTVITPPVMHARSSKPGAPLQRDTVALMALSHLPPQPDHTLPAPRAHVPLAGDNVQVSGTLARTMTSVTGQETRSVPQNFTGTGHSLPSDALAADQMRHGPRNPVQETILATPEAPNRPVQPAWQSAAASGMSRPSPDLVGPSNITAPQPMPPGAQVSAPRNAVDTPTDFYRTAQGNMSPIAPRMAGVSATVATDGGATDDDRLVTGLFGPADVSMDRASSASSTSALDPSHRPGTPATVQHVARQIVEVLPRSGDARLEITLTPEDLGRLKLTLVTGEGTPVLHITADRQETMELVRRHIDLLTREFTALGFAGLDVALGQDRRTPPQPSGAQKTDGAGANPPGSDPDSTQRPAAVQGSGLDIRL